MANRKLPFGYQMRNGKVEIHPVEAEVLHRIFKQYSSGVSYKELVNWLREQDVPYMPGKLWNKNMVARVLQDHRYTGTDGFLPLIDEMLYQTVQTAILHRTSPTKKDAECSAVQWFARCGVCGERVLRDSRQYGRERWQCLQCKSISTKATDRKLVSETRELLRWLLTDPDAVSCPDHNLMEADERIQCVESTLKEMLDIPEFNESAAKAKALSLAAARFNALGSEDYETMRIQYILAKAEQSDGFDVELLRQITSAILIHPSGAVSLKLKNGQIIERSDLA